MKDFETDIDVIARQHVAQGLGMYYNFEITGNMLIDDYLMVGMQSNDEYLKGLCCSGVDWFLDVGDRVYDGRASAVDIRQIIACLRGEISESPCRAYASKQCRKSLK